MYLYGNKFTAYTDPLTHVLSTAKVRDGLQILQILILRLYTNQGTLNSDADGLSWIPDSNQITSESIKAICNSTNISPCVPLELNTFDDFHLFCDGLVDMQI